MPFPCPRRPSFTTPDETEWRGEQVENGGAECN